MTTHVGQDIKVLYRKWLLDNFGHLLPKGETSSTAFMLIIASTPNIGKRQKHDAIAALRLCRGMFHCKDGVVTYSEPVQ